MRSSFPLRPAAGVIACAFVLVLAAPAGAVSFLRSENVEQQAAEWRVHADRPYHLGDWEYIRLARRGAAEAGPPNQHPFTLSAQQVTDFLRRLRVGAANEEYALFSEAELKQLGPFVAVALEQAGPDQDVVFLTKGRQDAAGLFGMDLANAGRLFVADGKLNLIVGSVHSEALNRLRPGIAPQVQPDTGSRARAAAGVALHGGTLVRRDWAAVDLGALAAPAPAPRPPAVAVPSATAAVASAVPLPLAGTIAMPAAPAGAVIATPAAQAGRAPAGGQEAAPLSPIETRLRLLQHLHSEKLITDTEYQQKRAEILKGM